MKKYFPVTLLAVAVIVAMGIISFVFVPHAENLISGMVATQVFIYETPPKGCSVNLTTGINMVSFLCVTGDRSLNSSLIDRQNRSLDYFAIYKFNADTPLANAWDSYNPALPNYTIQTLNRLNRRYGYVVVMNSDGEFFRDGFRFSNSDIQLYDGWNFVGYPSDNEINITEALEEIYGNYTRVEAFTPVNGSREWLLYEPDLGGTLENMTPMVGYWIFVNGSTIWVVDW